ncbi:MAG: hypothetical protein ACERK9_12905, partial [Deltaproteobacteria bacterium]
ISQARISIRLAVTSTKITSVIISTITKADKEKKNHKDHEVHKGIFEILDFRLLIIDCRMMLYAFPNLQSKIPTLRVLGGLQDLKCPGRLV